MPDCASKDWISAAEVCRSLLINPRALPRVVAASGIRTRTVPGTNTRYNAADVTRVAAESLKPTGADAQAVAS